ncbi:hypothetical protein CEXT_451571 [Caerostris extrusa]|uniref:Uncharacterized protein n=1 Tax=Caerostris extrusa TaxID=172846 RepID=A0AAV4RVF5_CAEEX|nr:hypothetical protein CEXT_451571 [Caerostris extrusa]
MRRTKNNYISIFYLNTKYTFVLKVILSSVVYLKQRDEWIHNTKRILRVCLASKKVSGDLEMSKEICFSLIYRWTYCAKKRKRDKEKSLKFDTPMRQVESGILGIVPESLFSPEKNRRSKENLRQPDGFIKIFGVGESVLTLISELSGGATTN